MGAQLYLKAALSLGEILAMCRKNVSNAWLRSLEIRCYNDRIAQNATEILAALLSIIERLEKSTPLPLKNIGPGTDTLLCNCK